MEQSCADGAKLMPREASVFSRAGTYGEQLTGEFSLALTPDGTHRTYFFGVNLFATAQR